MNINNYKGNNALTIRILDFVLSLSGLITLSPLILAVILLVFVIDQHPPLFTQTRLGKNKKPFKILKIRTMHPGAPELPAHQTDPSRITKLGRFLRKYKLDELPQLINVLKGEMSIVGPRPSIEKEIKVIELREKKGIYNFKPGVTGLATIKKVDMSKPSHATKLDELTMKNLTPCFYILLIILTITGKGFHDPAYN